ncbi:hypothetical protein [Mucilaginibacter sp. 3215]|uniref:hypothetical protein n=1 Tax=Mucilaginibacter sp. 3215 TaxID=3373912 RepID=UPI003D1ACB5E
MEKLTFNFCHPVKGLLRLLNKLYPAEIRVVQIDDQHGGLIEISVTGLCSGKWKAMLEWEHDGMNYYYEQEFEIPEVN